MHTTTKGVVAAGAAAVLLLGGAGTLAYWSDSATVSGGSVSTGSLGIDPGACSPTWSYANGTAAGQPIGQGIVPGDAVTKQCTFTVDASGDHLSASPSIPSTIAYTVSGGSPTTLSLPVSATYSLAGVPFSAADVITELDDGKTLTAQITVTFPFGSGTVNANDTQGLTASLNGLTVALTQTATGENAN